MQERLASLESALQKEQNERKAMERKVEERRNETASLQEQMQQLREQKIAAEVEKQQILADKNTMAKQIEKQNLEIEQLRQDLSRSRNNTPQREFESNTQSNPFSLVSTRPTSRPVLPNQNKGAVRATGLGFGNFGGGMRR